MIPRMWTERRGGHLFVWWRGRLIYKSGSAPRDLAFDPFGPPWELPREALRLGPPPALDPGADGR